MRKFLCLVILLSMALHSASRLGLLSYLYQNRHTIAYSLGLIEEIPIAMCSSDYNSRHELVFDHQDGATPVPATLARAHEINLFIQSIDLSIEPAFSRLEDQPLTIVIDRRYSSPAFSIFHPPAVS